MSERYVVLKEVIMANFENISEFYLIEENEELEFVRVEEVGYRASGLKGEGFNGFIHYNIFYSPTYNKEGFLVDRNLDLVDVNEVLELI